MDTCLSMKNNSDSYDALLKCFRLRISKVLEGPGSQAKIGRMMCTLIALVNCLPLYQSGLRDSGGGWGAGGMPQYPSKWGPLLSSCQLSVGQLQS